MEKNIIFVKNFITYCLIGIYPEEKKNKQKIKVSVKLNIKGLPDDQIPPLGKTFLSGIHFLIPIFVLVYLLLVERWTAASAVFYSILSLI